MIGAECPQCGAGLEFRGEVVRCPSCRFAASDPSPLIATADQLDDVQLLQWDALAAHHSREARYWFRALLRATVAVVICAGLLIWVTVPWYGWLFTAVVGWLWFRVALITPWELREVYRARRRARERLHELGRLWVGRRS